MNLQNIYNQKLTFSRILIITIPTILMTLIQASYSMIDGIFVSNILGSNALSSITLVSPYLNFFIAIGAMFASGGSATIMKQIGEGSKTKAKKNFTGLLLTSVFIGFIISTIFIIFTKLFVNIFKTNPEVIKLCKEYLFTYSFFIIPQILFSQLQIYTIACSKAKQAMIISIIGGITNIFLDYIMIYVLKMGMKGAALASGFGMLIPCIILSFIFINKQNILHFEKPHFDLTIIKKTISNGLSEFASNLVSGIVIMLFNNVMLKIAGSDGVSASSITFYIFGFMSALYMGYMLGVSPLISYFYGANQTEKLKKIRNISLILISIIAIITTILSIFGSDILVSIFSNPQTQQYKIAVSGNKLFSISLLFVGFNTFSSMLFTALSNGKISAIIAFSRTFIFLSSTIIILPIFFKINGLWLSVPVSEFMCILLSTYFVKKYKNKYNY